MQGIRDKWFAQGPTDLSREQSPPFHGSSASRISLRLDQCPTGDLELPSLPGTPKPRPLQRDQPGEARAHLFEPQRHLPHPAGPYHAPIRTASPKTVYLGSVHFGQKECLASFPISLPGTTACQGAFRSGLQRPRETFSREEPGCILC